MIQAKFKMDYKLFLSKMQQLEKKEIPYAKVVFKQLTISAFKMVKDLTPPTKGTNIKELWKLKYSRKAALEEYIVHNIYPNQDVLVYIEEGTRPHRIPIGPKGFLAWKDDDGDWIFTKKDVAHPGTKAHHMVEKTERAINVKTDSYIKQTLTRISKLSSKGAR